MRIVSWNMNRRGQSGASHKRAWDYLRGELCADLALVQEASPPDALMVVERCIYRPIDENSTNGARPSWHCLQTSVWERVDVLGWQSVT
jgi:hypothetical protein